MQAPFIKKIQQVTIKLHNKIRLHYEILVFDRFRAKYKSITFHQRKSLANKWLKRFPDQVRFQFDRISNWLEKEVEHL